MDFADVFSVFVNRPWLVLIICLPILALYKWLKLQRLLICGVAWFTYFWYELMISVGAICPEGCNIRVELIVLYPLLLGLTIPALVEAGKLILRKRRATE